MKTIGFLISHKNGEGRRALLPEHIGRIKTRIKCILRQATALPSALRTMSTPPAAATSSHARRR